MAIGTSYPTLIRTIGVHGIDFVMTITHGDKCNFTPVRRPVGIFITGGIICKANRIAAVAVHYIDFEVSVPLGLKSNFTSIGRPFRGPIQLTGWIFWVLTECIEYSAKVADMDAWIPASPIPYNRSPFATPFGILSVLGHFASAYLH